MGQKEKRILEIIHSTIYHPVDETEHEEFKNTLSSLLNSIPRSDEFIGGHNVNANLGVRSKIHRRVIGLYGINNRNNKGGILLGLFSANKLRVINTFYEKSSYTTWRSFHTSNTCHMLDVITSYVSFYKYILDCGVTPKGFRSDHSAVQMVFLNRTIKFKSDYMERPVIDWVTA